MNTNVPMYSEVLSLCFFPETFLEIITRRIWSNRDSMCCYSGRPLLSHSAFFQVLGLGVESQISSMKGFLGEAFEQCFKRLSAS